MRVPHDVELERIYNGLLRYEKRLRHLSVFLHDEALDRYRMAVIDISSCIRHIGEALDELPEEQP